MCNHASVVNPQHSGRFSTADGHFIAFGGTEEKAYFDSLGLAARDGDHDFNRLDGTGRIDAHDGDYADALSKSSCVGLYVAEPSGAISAPFDKLLRHHGRLSREPGVTPARIARCVASAPLDAASAAAVRRASASGRAEQRILSDANDFFIAAVLDARGLARHFARVATNPSRVERTDGGECVPSRS